MTRHPAPAMRSSAGRLGSGLLPAGKDANDRRTHLNNTDIASNGHAQTHEVGRDA
jgi:hypothetical protein